jgi:hypothetical protein
MTPDHYTRATAYLTKFYGAEVFTHNGIKHPIVVYPPEPHQIEDIDSIMGTLTLDSPSEFPIYDYGYLHTLQNSGRNVFNGVTYSLNYVEQHPLTLHGHMGRYYDMLATSGALENELKHTLESKLIRLPLRSQMHRTVNVSQALWNGAGRSATIGGACLVVYNDAGTYRAILARRSQRAATDPNFYHVLPAFIFQPTEADQAQSQWRISQHIYREYLEELFGASETSTTSAEWIFAHPAMRDLQAMMDSGLASLYLTGITMNLLTLRPEICALLLIRDAAWWVRVNESGSPIALNTHSEAQDGVIARVPIETDEGLLAQLPPDLHTLMPPQAYTALWLGVEMARRKIEND